MQWLKSAVHCGNIYDEDFNRIGVGYVAKAGQAYWSHTFATNTDPFTNPLFDGTHYVGGSLTNNKARFLVS